MLGAKGLDTDLSRDYTYRIPLTDSWFTVRSLTLHAAIGSYMQPQQSRNAIKAGLEQVYHACATSELRAAPVSVTVAMGEQRTLLAFPFNRFGDQLGRPKIIWTSNAPTIVAQSAGGGNLGTVARGVQPGTSTFTARWRTRTTSVPVSVRAPNPADRWSYTYVSEYPAGFYGQSRRYPGGPMPAGRLILRFEPYVGASGRVAWVDNQADGDYYGSESEFFYRVSEYGPDSLKLYMNAPYYLGWNADDSALTGTLETTIYNPDFQRVSLPVRFVRMEPNP